MEHLYLVTAAYTHSGRPGVSFIHHTERAVFPSKPSSEDFHQAARSLLEKKGIQNIEICMGSGVPISE